MTVSTKDRAERGAFAYSDFVLRCWPDGCHRARGYDKIVVTLVDAERDLA